MDSIEPQKAAVGLVNFISEIFDCVGADQRVCPIRRNHESKDRPQPHPPFQGANPGCRGLPTYGISLDLPITKKQVASKLRALAARVKKQMQDDEIIRQRIENMGYLEFDTDSL